jgi:hypothetical protein
MAAQTAFLAVIPIARAAEIAVVASTGVATVVAGDAFPFGKGNIRTIGAVGIQNAFNECEKIIQPAILKRSPYCGGAITLAKLFVADMRMCDLF